MSLELDPRRRAMLAEMGLQAFVPVAGAASSCAAQEPAPVEAPAVVAESVAPAPARLPAAPPQVMRDQATVRVMPSGGEAGGRFAEMDWDELQQAAAGCQACALGETRRQVVFGSGPRQADWLVVGDAPSEQDELQGEPFAGEEGRLLDQMLRAVGLARGEGVYLTHLLKCRPPGNRNPAPEEIASCEPILRRQLALLRPKVVLLMGRLVVPSLLQTTEPLGRLRGRVHQWQGVPVVVTYHPSFLLRNPAEKGKAWADWCLADEARNTGFRG
ncbi:uracil-DNA glycosylase [Ramlibacter sp. AW1]|uniref:Type-4 uracil-DNA glycosylase n=1 Tax=Ramlibacter aurantiacus TaxID=2801330 RepID=A0A937D3Y1_9BURK|nr:uracil-DNA glycosylase [Ramlibacter aurantiacus]MBL0421160.1 uracil-DNA glycosylase [Ramlibacter aurantiacus]